MVFTLMQAKINLRQLCRRFIKNLCFFDCLNGAVFVAHAALDAGLLIDSTQAGGSGSDSSNGTVAFAQAAADAFFGNFVCHCFIPFLMQLILRL